MTPWQISKWVWGWLLFLAVAVAFNWLIWEIVERTNRRVESMYEEINRLERQTQELQQMLEDVGADDRLLILDRLELLGPITDPCLRGVAAMLISAAKDDAGTVQPDRLDPIIEALEVCREKED